MRRESTRSEYGGVGATTRVPFHDETWGRHGRTWPCSFSGTRTASHVSPGGLTPGRVARGSRGRQCLRAVAPAEAVTPRSPFSCPVPRTIFPPMTSAEIRRKFLAFFAARGHREVPSAPLVPAEDPTLLFTNAGMVQFKRVFQGLERRDYTRAVTCQKCVRAGGKHNDLEQVGHTARHHTFFEMLGNFSFGDYFKQEAIEYAWEWVTGKDWLGIAPDRLYVTVHHSDYDTDVFMPIIERAVEVVGTRYDRGERGASYRVLADHARAVAFLLADGVYPSNEGRGYVLRRILRRAVRHAWLLGRREPTLVHLARTVEDLMGGVYPELVRKRADIESVIRAEEERFFDTIEGGLARLEELKGTPVISGEDAFKLYDTYGFPIDLTQLIAAERGQAVDIAGFEQALTAQRQRSRAVGTR